MKLYHGSKVIVNQPIVKGSNKSNDYGPAFYMTKDFDSACEWACRNNTIGYVNEYRLNISGLSILDLREYSVLHWLAILLHFRTLDDGFIKAFKTRLEYLENNYYINVDDYDVVIGYRADDAYFRFPLDFVRGNITIEQLDVSFKLGNLGIQYVLMSGKAINKLQFNKSYLADKKYVNQYFEAVKKATLLFDSLSKDDDGTRIIDIMRSDKK